MKLTFHQASLCVYYFFSFFFFFFWGFNSLILCEGDRNSLQCVYFAKDAKESFLLFKVSLYANFSYHQVPLMFPIYFLFCTVELFYYVYI